MIPLPLAGASEPSSDGPKSTRIPDAATVLDEGELIVGQNRQYVLQAASW